MRARSCAQQAAVGAHRHLGAPLGHRDRDRDRGALDAQQLVGDLRDHVAVVVAHVADRRRCAPRPSPPGCWKAARAVGVPLRRHAVVAQVVERCPASPRRASASRTSGSRAASRRAAARSCPCRCRARPPRGPRAQRRPARRRPAASAAMNAEVEPTGRPTNASLHAPHALRPAVLLDLVRVGVVVGHEEVLLHRLHAARVRHARAAARCPPCSEPARQAARCSGRAASMPQRATRLRFCGWPRLPVRMRTSLAPSSRRIASQQHRAAQRVGVAHPLREDVGAAAADRLGAALQARCRRRGPGASIGQVLRRERLPRMRPKRGHHHVGAGHAAPAARATARSRRSRRCALHAPARRAGSASGMEAPPSLRHVHEQPAGAKRSPCCAAQPLQHLHREARAEVVEVAEGPAQERREAQAEDGAHVAVARRAQDALLQAAAPPRSGRRRPAAPGSRAARRGRRAAPAAAASA